MNKFSLSAFLYYGQYRMFTKVMSVLVISYMVLGRTNNDLPDLQLGFILHRVILSMYYPYS